MAMEAGATRRDMAATPFASSDSGWAPDTLVMGGQPDPAAGSREMTSAQSAKSPAGGPSMLFFVGAGVSMMLVLLAFVGAIVVLGS
ncbi:MAG: hypothetical protein AAF401_07885 [Pseudomonadota bacterium]